MSILKYIKRNDLHQEGNRRIKHGWNQVGGKEEEN
jgi:hypothetical protein